MPEEMSLEEFEKLPKTTSEKHHEERARSVMSDYLGVSLNKEKVRIFQKEKEFDFFNRNERVIGDAKHFKRLETAEKDNIHACVWLMEKLEQSTGMKWRKIIVGGGERILFEQYSRLFDAWLGDLKVYFLSEDGGIVEIRTRKAHLPG